jgi:hypothetical protein
MANRILSAMSLSVVLESRSPSPPLFDSTLQQSSPTVPSRSLITFDYAKTPKRKRQQYFQQQNQNKLPKTNHSSFGRTPPLEPADADTQSSFLAPLPLATDAAPFGQPPQQQASLPSSKNAPDSATRKSPTDNNSSHPPPEGPQAPRRKAVWRTSATPDIALSPPVSAYDEPRPDIAAHQHPSIEQLDGRLRLQESHHYPSPQHSSASHFEQPDGIRNGFEPTWGVAGPYDYRKAYEYEKSANKLLKQKLDNAGSTIHILEVQLRNFVQEVKGTQTSQYEAGIERKQGEGANFCRRNCSDRMSRPAQDIQSARRRKVACESCRQRKVIPYERTQLLSNASADTMLRRKS